MSETPKRKIALKKSLLSALQSFLIVVEFMPLKKLQELRDMLFMMDPSQCSVTLYDNIISNTQNRFSFKEEMVVNVNGGTPEEINLKEILPKVEDREEESSSQKEEMIIEEVDDKEESDSDQ